LRLVDAKRQSPIPGHRQAPGALPIASQLMGLPAWDSFQFGFFLHVLKKGDHTAQLLYDRRLDAARVISLNEAPKALMKNIPNLYIDRIPETTAACKATLYEWMAGSLTQ
jgi:hypothetical protein